MKPITLRAALREGLSLLDYAILLVLSSKSNLSRSDMESLTGMGESAVRRSTIRLRERGMIASDRKHPIGGAKKREARYSLT